MGKRRIRADEVTFDHLFLLPDPLIRKLCLLVDKKTLDHAFKTAPSEVVQKVIDAAPDMMKNQLQTMIERLPPLHLSEIEAAQADVVMVMKHLFEENVIEADFK